MNTQVLGISVDPIPSIKAWAETFGGIEYPLLSDFWPHGSVSTKYGVLRSEGYSERALFLLDRYGIIRYIDVHDIDTQPDNQVLFDEIRKMDPQTASLEQRASAAEPVDAAPIPQGGVVMYCTAWCPACKRARRWLGERNITYTEVDIHTTAGAASQLRQWTGGNLTTPTFNVNGEILVNFDELRMAEVLRKQQIMS